MYVLANTIAQYCKYDNSKFEYVTGNNLGGGDLLNYIKYRCF